jgi:hypothetical protein
MCKRIRTLNNEIRKETQTKSYNGTCTYIYRSEIWTTTKKQEAKIETAEMKFLTSVADYMWQDQIRYA